MKKQGILNAQLSRLIAALGHKDTYMIGDAGMPIPPGVEVVDLAVTSGVPTFRQVFDAVLAEDKVEAYTLAKEIETANPDLHAYIKQALKGLPVTYVPHEELKKQSAHCRFAIRTGEFTPYPNIILQSGVVF